MLVHVSCPNILDLSAGHGFFALSISSASEILSAARILFQMSQDAVETWNIPEPADDIISCYFIISNE